MSHLPVSSFLRKVLLADAVISAAVGAVMLAGAAALETLLALPRALFVPVGAGLIVYATVLICLARRDQVQTAAVWTLVGLNVLWAVECVAVPLGIWLHPNALGQAFLGAQVVVVLVLAELYVLNLRKAARASAVDRGMAQVRRQART